MLDKRNLSLVYFPELCFALVRRRFLSDFLRQSLTEIFTNKTYFITLTSQQDVKNFKTSFIPIFLGPEVPGLDIIVRSECVECSDD